MTRAAFPHPGDSCRPASTEQEVTSPTKSAVSPGQAEPCSGTLAPLRIHYLGPILKLRG